MFDGVRDMFGSDFSEGSNLLRQPVEHGRNHGGSQQASDEQLLNGHTRSLADERYGSIAIRLTLCFMLKTGLRALRTAVLLVLLTPPSQATILAHQTAPDFPSPSTWLNSPPLTFQALGGKVLLVDFWDSTCSNCLHTLDHLKTWDQKYRSLGLVIIGVHTPEFKAESDPKKVQQAAQRLGLTYPIVLDNDHRIWQSYSVGAWPTLFLVGPDRRVLYRHIGEGRYPEIEQQIRNALKAAHPGLTLPD